MISASSWVAGVGEHHGVDLLHIERRRRPVELAQLLEPLKQAAVDEHRGAAGFEQILRAGDGAGGAVEGEFCHGRQS
jgi:hypothetical protein